MLVDVLALVRDLAPDVLRHPAPSVICVRTTHPKYLVFDADASHPSCVVEIGDGARLTRIQSILTELHRRIPRFVPRPIACVPWRHGTHVQIQSGLAGVPWFRIGDYVETPSEWRTLLNRSVAVMLRMHAAVKEVPEWTGTIDVRTALLDQLHRCSRHDDVSRHVVRVVEQCARDIGDAGALSATWQHGDFSLNNLMISPDSMAMIDFDEFGRTQMPLHDAFGLALSFPLSQGDRCPIPVEDCIARCIEAAVDNGRFDRTVVEGLLFHHLLWRINESHGHATRALLRDRLRSVVEHVARAGDGFAPAVAAAFSANSRALR